MTAPKHGRSEHHYLRADRRDDRRAGHTIVELVVALPMALLVAAAAALMLVRVGRTVRTQDGVLANTRELRHARLAIAADLEPLRGADLAVVSDTLLEFRGRQGVLTLCAVPTAIAIIAATPPGSSDLWLSGLRGGDEVEVWHQGSPTDRPVPHARALVDAPGVLDSAPCGADSSSAPARRWRLVLASPVPPLMSGAPVAVYRPVRYRHYQSGGRWWLGRQGRSGAGWETIQPVAGPLRPPGTGVRIVARDAAGTPVPVAPGAPDSLRQRVAFIEVSFGMLRPVRDDPGHAADSAGTSVPLRAGGTVWAGAAGAGGR